MDDFSGLEYDQESVSEGDVISKTNSLLSQFNLPTKVTSVQEISASLFVVLYESLFSDRLPGIIRQPVTLEDEIHNCQMVIDVLSTDVIKDNLSHIRGVDIVEGKVQSINNLLDIFTFLYEYVIKQIESDVPTDAEDDTRSLDWQEGAAKGAETVESLPSVDAQEPERLQSGLQNKTSAKNVELNGVGHVISAGTDSNGSLKATSTGPNKVPVAAVRSRPRGETAPRAGTVPSPIRHDASASLMGYGTLDSTEDLIQEGERLDKQLKDKDLHAEARIAWDRPGGDGQPGQFDFIGVRPLPTSVATSVAGAAVDAPGVTTFPHTAASGDAFLESAVMRGSAARESTYATAAAHPAGDPRAWSATAPPQHRNQSLRPRENLRSTVGPVAYHSRQTPEKPYHHREPPVKGLSSSYEDLHHMVEKTAAMTRVALDTSPMRMRQDRAALLDITDLSQERHQIPRGEALALARELNLDTPQRPAAYPLPTQEAQGIPHDVRSRRQVAFLQNRSSSDEPLNDVTNRLSREELAARIPPNTDYRGPAARPVPRPEEKLERERRPAPQPRSGHPVEPERKKRTDRLKERLSEAVDDMQSPGSEVDDMASVRRRRVEGKERQVKLSRKLSEMGKPMLADAQRHLELEDKTYQHRQDFLKKVYEEEFDDVLDEVKNLVGKDRTLMRDMEEEYRKLMLIAAGKVPKKPKPATKPKGYLLPTTRKSKSRPPSRSKSQQKRSGTEEVPKPRERPLSIGDDEDLMPVLLEEFPHLYLSEHTWHELWRRGITQIENLTQAYEENKRRKSRAQLQLEEAARKHEILASIVKKQLEQGQRTHQLKEQKRQKVMVKNRLQEKRSQSARARRYYNEYQVRARAKMLKRRSREEMIFKNLFKDGLAIQKERIQEVRRYAKEQRDKQAKKRQDDIDSLENYYRDQFEILVAKLISDQQDMTAREQAHEKVLQHMKKDLRRKMEKEIQDIQQQMFRDEDDAYFRQLEADRLRQELQLAKYQTRV